MAYLNLKIVLLILFVLALGIKSTIDDLKHKKVYNITVALFICVGVVLNLSTGFYELRINFLINLGFALFVGFLLWYVNFWNAGDGKLFLAFTALIPIELVFSDKTQLYAYNLITYTVVPIFFVFAAFVLFQVTRQEILNTIKESFKLKIVINIILAFFAFQWVIQSVNEKFGLRLNMFLGVIVLFFVFDMLEKFSRINLINIFYATAALRMIFDTSEVFSMFFLVNFAFQILMFLVFVYFLIYLAYFKFGVHVPIPDLKEGMNLCEKIVRKGDKYTVLPDIKISLFMFLHDKMKTDYALENTPEGLSRSQIQKIQEWNRQGKMEVGALLVQKRIPYAPFQFIGAVLLIIASVLI